MASYLPGYDRCPICDSRAIASAFTMHYWRENALRYWDCADCGASFANPMPSDGLIAAGNEALVRWYQQDRTFENEFRDARQAYLRGRLLVKRLSRWRRTGRLLDVGCNNGFLPLGISDHSQWSVEGVEISHELSTFIEEKLGIRCHEGTLESVALPASSYDFILCHDLIEHINQPGRFLSEIGRILKPGGRIQIITPNARQDLAFPRRADRAGTPVTMLLNHILFFSPRTLRCALERAGLRILKLYCYDVRYALKDFGALGMNPPRDIQPGPSMNEALKLEMMDNLKAWNPTRIEELRSHRKVSLRYGFWRETLPATFKLRIPERVGIGHEIYALAEKA